MFQRKLKFLLLVGICTSIKAEEIPNCDYFDTVDLTGIEKLSNGSYNYEGVMIPPEQTGTYNYKILFEGTNITNGTLHRSKDDVYLSNRDYCLQSKELLSLGFSCRLWHQNYLNELHYDKSFYDHLLDNLDIEANWKVGCAYFNCIFKCNDWSIFIYLLGPATLMILIKAIFMISTICHVHIENRKIRKQFEELGQPYIKNNVISLLPVLFLDLYPSGVTSFDTFNGLRLVGAKAPPSLLLPPPGGDRIAACPRVQLLPGGQFAFKFRTAQMS
ncbi:hypothetical protein ACLKA7_004492 [Drosophila subpalustris]